VKAQNRVRLERAASSVRYEWSEAPWFVILMIAIAAFVSATLIWRLASLF